MVRELSANLEVVLSHYDLGELQAHVRDERGTVNTSFVIDLLQGGRPQRYFLRCYRPGIGVDEIRFEHALIDHVSSQGTCPVARVQRTRQGETYLRLRDGSAGQAFSYFAVFDFLPGDDRYTWVAPRCTKQELRNAGDLLARFHAAVNNFEPSGNRAEPKILDLLPQISNRWAAAPALSKGTVFDASVQKHFREIQACIEQTAEAFRASAVDALPELVIHCDYHPGNLKFEGEAISGLVDFDWAKLDLRAFDVGLALWYFCASWDTGSDGVLRLDDLNAFLSAYQARLGSPSDLPALGPDELNLLPDLVQAGNVYVIDWTLRDYFGSPVDPLEYLRYLEHHLHTSRWLASAENRRDLEICIAGLTGR